jgi:hypothetical protein
LIRALLSVAEPEGGQEFLPGSGYREPGGLRAYDFYRHLQIALDGPDEAVLEGEADFFSRLRAQPGEK